VSDAREFANKNIHPSTVEPDYNSNDKGEGGDEDDEEEDEEEAEESEEEEESRPKD
jgi:hypothetical protein